MTSLSPATIGDESPLGAGTFHFTFFSGPNSTGGFCPSATPDPPGPRNCGQASGLSALSPTAANTPSAIIAMKLFMSITSDFRIGGCGRTLSHYGQSARCGGESTHPDGAGPDDDLLLGWAISLRCTAIFFGAAMPRRTRLRSTETTVKASSRLGMTTRSPRLRLRTSMSSSLKAVALGDAGIPRQGAMLQCERSIRVRIESRPPAPRCLDARAPDDADGGGRSDDGKGNALGGGIGQGVGSVSA